MANSSRVILLDIDGTLVNYRAELPDSAAAAVEEARERGHRIFLSTGRSRAEIPPFLWDLGIDGLIGGNGSYLEVGGEVVHHQVLDPSVVERVVRWFLDHGLDFYLECNSALYGSANLSAKMAALLGGDTEENRQWVTDHLPHVAYRPGAGHDDVNKISFVLEPVVDLERLAAELEGQAKVDTWSLTGEGPELGEIGQIGVHKGVAVELLSEHLGVAVEAFISFGDARADLELLTICGTGVAMGNAPEALKEAADLVTDHVDADGLANAFRALGLTGGASGPETTAPAQGAAYPAVTPRLVAVDMDGTFLDPQHAYDIERFARVHERLRAADIRFVVASGNQLWRLLSYFEDVEDVLYVAENGAVVADAHKFHRVIPFDPAAAAAALAVVDRIPEIFALACGPRSAYTLPSVEPDVLELTREYYKRLELVDSWADIDEEIVKIALFSRPEEVPALLARLAEDLPPEVVPVSSGHHTVDLISRGVNKGTGLAWLGEELGIRPEEMVAFGDGGNDVEMLDLVGTAVVMSNAPAEVKKHADVLAGRNDEAAVLAHLEGMLDELDQVS